MSQKGTTLCIKQQGSPSSHFRTLTKEDKHKNNHWLAWNHLHFIHLLSHSHPYMIFLFPCCTEEEYYKSNTSGIKTAVLRYLTDTKSSQQVTHVLEAEDSEVPVSTHKYSVLISEVPVSTTSLWEVSLKKQQQSVSGWELLYRNTLLPSWKVNRRTRIVGVWRDLKRSSVPIPLPNQVQSCPWNKVLEILEIL